MTYSPEVRRHHNISIDFDAYRITATAPGQEAMRDAHALRAVTAGTMVLAGVLGFALVIPSNFPRVRG